MLTQKLLWARGGSGPELAGPHSLFETSFNGDRKNWLVDPQACKTILALISSQPAMTQPADIEQLDIFHAFALVAILLQRRAAIPVEKFSVVYREAHMAWVAIEHISAPAAQMAAGLAVQFVQIMNGARSASNEQIAEGIFEFEGKCGFTTAGHKFLYAEAVRRDIPVHFVPPNNLMFGYGRNRRRLSGGTTENTPQLAVRTASDKSATIDALRYAGLPVPRHMPVKDIEEAKQAAAIVGYPLVVKPVNTDQGVGITAGVRNAQELEAAYRKARAFSDRIAVEQFLPGDTFRLLVINGQFVAACKTQPTPIVGDGVSTIRQLVRRVNLSPLRGPGHHKPLTWLEFDDEARDVLMGLSLKQDSVLPFGRTIRLRTASNLSKGGQSVSVNDIIHPDNIRLAETCAKVIGLDITGIDFRTEAIDRSWKDTHCGIIEMNPNPGTRMHWQPALGPPADVATPMFDLLYPNNAPKRIPIVAVTGTNGKTTTVRMIAHILSETGLTVGSTTTNEVTVGGRIVQSGDSAGPGPARRVLSVPLLEAAVLETARGAIIKFGLGFDRCDVAVITNIADDHLGELGVRSLEELAAVKATVAKSAKAVVLNADNHFCLSIRSMLAGQQVVLFSAQADNPAVREHVEAGGTAYAVAEAAGRKVITRHRASKVDVLAEVADIPLTLNGQAAFNAKNTLAALAAVDCLGIAADVAVRAAASFQPSTSDNLGRLNFIEGFPFKILIDYAHNKPAFAAICEFLRACPRTGERYCVVSMNGARISDATATDAMTALAGHFDKFFTCNVGPVQKRRDELAAVLAEGLIGSGVPSHVVTVCGEQKEAIRKAIGQAQPGDLVVILDVFDPPAVVEMLAGLADNGVEDRDA